MWDFVAYFKDNMKEKHNWPIITSNKLLLSGVRQASSKMSIECDNFKSGRKLLIDDWVKGNRENQCLAMKNSKKPKVQVIILKSY